MAGLFHGEIEVAGAVVLEQRLAELRADGPVALEGIDIGDGDAAAQVALDVLDVLGLPAVDVAREVEVELVLLDLRRSRPCGSISGTSRRLLKTSTILWMSMVAEAVLGAVLHEARAGVDHEDALAGVGVFLVDDDDAGGDAGAVEEVGGQADDALDVAFADEGAADIGFGIAAEEDAVGQNAGAFAGALERADDVEQIGVVALPGGRRAEGFEAVVGVLADRRRCSSACR